MFLYWWICAQWDKKWAIKDANAKECLKLVWSPSHTDHSSLHASWLSYCLSEHTHTHNPRCYVPNCFSRESQSWNGSSLELMGLWGRTRGLWEPVRVAWNAGSVRGLYGESLWGNESPEEDFERVSPLPEAAALESRSSACFHALPQRPHYSWSDKNSKL